MILFTMYGFFYKGYDGNERKKPEKYMYTKNKEKFPVWFPDRKKPETSRTYPRWDGNPNL